MGTDFTFTTTWDDNQDFLPDEWELAVWNNVAFRYWFADDDRDGLNNRLEYALGTNPRKGESTPAVPYGIDADGRLSVTLAKRPYVTLHVEVCGDLKTWDPAKIVREDETSLTAQDTQTQGTSGGRFLRVRVTSP